MFEGDLTEYVAAAGLRWMVIGKPEQLSREQSVTRSLARLLPNDKLDAFARSTGVDVRRVPQGLIAGFDYATLYMAEVKGSHAAIIRRFSERLHDAPAVRHPHPDLTWVTGTVAGVPETLLSFDGHWVAISVGDPTPTRVAEAYARRKLKRSPTALHGAALSHLPGDLVDAPLCFLAPGPFEGQWSNGLHGLLRDAVAVGICARPVEDERVRVRAVVAGDFGSRGATSSLLSGWEDLAKSDLGRLLRLNEPATPARTLMHPSDVELDVDLELTPIADGLYAAVASDVWDMLGTSASQSAPWPGSRGGARAPAVSPARSSPSSETPSTGAPDGGQ